MTAKEALRERVDRLSEDEAAEWLARMDWESTDTESLSNSELSAVVEADAEVRRGEWVDGEQALHALGL
jgi:hypothetical protein